MSKRTQTKNATVLTLEKPIQPLALRHRDAARMLGISESELRKWVEDGRISPPYTIKDHVVLFDANQLAQDWERIKDACSPREWQTVNPWDQVLTNE